MKKPLFDEIDRAILKGGNDLYASRMNLQLASHRLCKVMVKQMLKYFIPIYLVVSWSVIIWLIA